MDHMRIVDQFCPFENVEWRNGDSPFNHLLESIPVSESSSSYPDILLQSQVLDLMKNRFLIVFSRRSILIRFDRSNIGRLRSHEFLDESVSGSL